MSTMHARQSVYILPRFVSPLSCLIRTRTSCCRLLIKIPLKDNKSDISPCHNYIRTGSDAVGNGITMSFHSGHNNVNKLLIPHWERSGHPACVSTWWTNLYKKNHAICFIISQVGPTSRRITSFCAWYRTIS